MSVDVIGCLGMLEIVWEYKMLCQKMALSSKKLYHCLESVKQTLKLCLLGHTYYITYYIKTTLSTKCQSMRPTPIQYNVVGISMLLGHQPCLNSILIIILHLVFLLFFHHLPHTIVTTAQLTSPSTNLYHIHNGFHERNSFG